jgi:hypothetical protein
MKKKLAVLLAISAATSLAQAQDEAPVTEAGFRFQIGLTFVSGLSDLSDKIERNNPNVSVDSRLPAGLAFSARREFEGGFGAGFTIGPAILGIGDASLHVVPVGLDVRYRILPSGRGGAYVRAGAEKAFAGGDYVKDGSAGAAVGIGWESSGSTGWGVELAYRSYQVTVLATPGHPEVKARPTKGALAVFFVF